MTPHCGTPRHFAPLAVALLLSASSAAAEPPGPSTFSIVAADPAAGEVGVAVASRFFAVGAVVPFARGGVGADGCAARPKHGVIASRNGSASATPAPLRNRRRERGTPVAINGPEDDSAT